MPKRPRRPKSSNTLAELLTARSAGVPPSPHWSDADRALVAEDYSAAAAGYARAANSDDSEKAKHGFCLGMLQDDDSAEALLTEANVGSHPEALALLAWVLGGDWGSRIRGFGGADQRGKERRERVDALLKAALAPDCPPTIAFNALFRIKGTYKEDSAVEAARARLLYPNWAWPHAIIAAKKRVEGVLDPVILDGLMSTLTNARHESAFQEAYVHAMQLERWGDAERVIEVLEKLVSQDTQSADGNIASLIEMRAMVSLHQARAGDTEAYETVLDQIATIIPAVPRSADGRDATVAPKFLLQVALETGQWDRLSDAVAALVERAWESGGSFGEDLDSWSPCVKAAGMHGVIRFGHFGFDFCSRSRVVEPHLTGMVRDRWRLMMAADATLHREPDLDQVQLLCATSVCEMPWWIGRAVFEAHANYADDPLSAGAVLAELAERSADAPPAEDERYSSVLESLGVYVDSLDDAPSVFTGALGWLGRSPAATGQALLEQWGEELANVDGGKAVLARIAALSLSRTDSQVARAMRELSDEPVTPEARLAAALERYPKPESTQVRVEDLSLLEAAGLVALLRGSPLDHVHWTLAPLEASDQDFEPTQKFIGTLFGLMHKGVIAIDESTPAGVVTLGDDGQLFAYLRKVVWRISSSTLALQREIRDLPRRHWPEAWGHHAPVLARDIGVEELVVYIAYLLNDRGLPVPEKDDVRVLFRTQLEHLSISQCYYLVHKTMRETLDYQARYRPGRPQIQARIINLLRGNGEKAISAGWDTKYSRIRELPPSLLWDALHDVFTGWGQAAFDKPVMSLTLEDVDPSPAQH